MTIKTIHPEAIINAIVALVFVGAMMWMHQGGTKVIENNTSAVISLRLELQSLNRKTVSMEKTLDETREDVIAHRREFAAITGLKRP